MPKRKPKQRPNRPDRPTLNRAILWAALRAVATKELEKVRTILEPGKLYPFSIELEAAVGKPSQAVTLAIAGDTNRGHDSQRDRSPAGFDLLCAAREILPAAEWRRLTRRLGPVLQKVDLDKHEAAVEKLLGPLKSKKPRAGEVKATYQITMH